MRRFRFLGDTVLVRKIEDPWITDYLQRLEAINKQNALPRLQLAGCRRLIAELKSRNLIAESPAVHNANYSSQLLSVLYPLCGTGDEEIPEIPLIDSDVRDFSAVGYPSSAIQSNGEIVGNGTNGFYSGMRPNNVGNGADEFGVFLYYTGIPNIPIGTNYNIFGSQDTTTSINEIRMVLRSDGAFRYRTPFSGDNSSYPGHRSFDAPEQYVCLTFDINTANPAGLVYRGPSTSAIQLVPNRTGDVPFRSFCFGANNNAGLASPSFPAVGFRMSAFGLSRRLITGIESRRIFESLDTVMPTTFFKRPKLF